VKSNQKLINYEKDERELTDKLLSHIPSVESVEYTKGRIAYDAIITLKNNKKILTEVKVRNCFIETYPNYVLQVDKLVSLLKYKIKNGYEMILFLK